MGCTPARPINDPILATPPNNNKVCDNNIDRLDQRVLSQKFVPVKTSLSGQIETAEAPNILAFDPRGVKKDYDVSGLPHYSSDNVTLNGKWQYLDINQSEVPFNRETQHKIEKDYIKGHLRSEITLFDSYAVVVFKDMQVTGDRQLPEGLKDHYCYPVKRMNLRREAYGWIVDDGTTRPIVRELEDILNFTTGVYTFGFDDEILTIDITKKAIINTRTAMARPFISLSI